MEIRSNRARRSYGAVVAWLLLAVLAACASTGKQQQPLRTYANLDGKELTPFVAAIFKQAGYATSPCHHARVCLETSWKEYNADVRGVRWQARRMYTVWFELGSLQDQYNLFLELVVQGKPPAGSEWIREQVVPEQDGEYGSLLQEIDRMVKQLGGVQY
jgi:uncharacterized lipoprotein